MLPSSVTKFFSFNARRINQFAFTAQVVAPKRRSLLGRAFQRRSHEFPPARAIEPLSAKHHEFRVAQHREILERVALQYQKIRGQAWRDSPGLMGDAKRYSSFFRRGAKHVYRSKARKNLERLKTCDECVMPGIPASVDAMKEIP